MEVWRPEVLEGRRPKVLSGRNLCLAVAIHVAAFAGFYIFAAMHGFFKKEEDITVIDLTVVVNENLDGKENEPPPVRKPDPPPPKPKPKPKPKPREKEPEKPKPLEQIVTNVVTKVEKKPEKKEEKKEEKKPEEKKPEAPKLSAAELRKKRIEEMRRSATTVKTKVTIEVKNAPSGDGKTQKKTLTDAQIRDLLNKGYKPGATTQLAKSEEDFAFSLIKDKVYDKWDRPPWTDTLRPMTLRVYFGPGGKIVNYRLEKSSGDAAADQSVKSAVARVGAIPSLPKAFIEKYRSKGVPIDFTVTPR